MKYGLFIILLLSLVSCAGVSKSELSRAKAIAMSKERFIENPFGFELTLDNFEYRYGKSLKRQRYSLESPSKGNNVDTIYRFYKRKTEIFFYKPMKLEAKLIAGNIYRSDIELKNEIRVGMSRKEFFWRFSDWLYDSSDSLVLESSDSDYKLTFIFSRDKLNLIRIANKAHNR